MCVEKAQCSNLTLDILLRHNCWYLLSRAKNLPVACRAIFLTNDLCNKQMYSECKKLFKDLDCLKYAVIKGIVLSNQIYGQTGFRLSQDIDILVSPEGYAEAKAVLSQNGFIQGKMVNGKIIPYSREELIFYHAFTHQVAPFVKPSNEGIPEAINIDVNLSVLWGESNQKIDMTEYMTHTTTMTLFDFEVKKLIPEYEFISLCLHHYKDMNSIFLLAKKGLSLSLYCDLYFYIKRVPMHIKLLKEIAVVYHVDAYIYYCIYFVHELFQDEMTQKILNIFRGSKNEELIDSFGLDDLERKKWKVPFFERLFDSNFKYDFIKMLEPRDIDKLNINLKYL